MIHCGIVQSGRKSNGAKGRSGALCRPRMRSRAIQGSGIYKIRSAFAGLLRRLEQKTGSPPKRSRFLGEDFRGTQEACCVGIVPTGVHDSVCLRTVLHIVGFPEWAARQYPPVRLRLRCRFECLQNPQEHR